nr:MAG TPA: hypothetical protein [Caudoviricetes sp.]
MKSLLFFFYRFASVAIIKTKPLIYLNKKLSGVF